MENDLWRLKYKYENYLIKEFRNKINDNPDPELLKNLYIFMSDIAPEFYVDDDMHITYAYLKDSVINCEYKYDGQYIIDALPDFNNNNELFMDKLVHQIRLYLLKLCWVKKKNYSSAIKEKDFVNYCVKSSEKVKEICDKLGIKCNSLVIHPGYDEQANLYQGCGFHAFNIVTFCGQPYLVDCTYRQFFNTGDNLIERLNVVGLAGCKAGCFMLMNDDRKKLAETLIQKGYVKLNEKVLKDYLDGFTMSFRNGLYYEETGDYSFTTPYTFDEYIDFLTGKDSQVKREGNLVLGYYNRPVRKCLKSST